MADVMDQLPDMVKAKVYLALELRRLTNDPFFGDINTCKIFKVNKKLKQS
jgi:hypothetical protein